MNIVKLLQYAAQHPEHVDLAMRLARAPDETLRELAHSAVDAYAPAIAEWARARQAQVSTAPTDGAIEADYRVVDDGSGATFLAGLAERKHGLDLILGRRGTGKTALSFVLAELHQCDHTFVINRERRPIPKWCTRAELGNLPDIAKEKGTKCIILDDAIRIRNSMQSIDRPAQDLINFVEEARHERLLFIVNSQSSSALFKYLQDADSYFFKPMSPVWIGLERQEMRHWYKQATEFFDTIPAEERVRWVYCVSVEPEYMGALEYDDPGYGDTT